MLYFCYQLSQIGSAKLNGDFFLITAIQILADYYVKFTNEHNITLQLISKTKMPGIVEFIHEDMTFFGNTVTKQGLPP